MGKLYSTLQPSFMKSALEGENEEVVERLLEYKKAYELETDKDKKVMYRERFSSAFWEIYSDIVYKIATKWYDKVPLQKKLLVRFGILDLKYLTPEDQEMIKMVPVKKAQSDDEIYNSVFYVDEWFEYIGKGIIEPSATDEVPRKRKKGSVNILDKEKYERKKGLLDAELSTLRELFRKRQVVEESIYSSIKRVLEFSQNFSDVSEDDYSVGYTDNERNMLNQSLEFIKDALKLDREIELSKQRIDKLVEDISKLEVVQQNDNTTSEEYEVDESGIKSEINSVRQMIKMCVGRQGNHFPILTSSMLPRSHLKPNFRENFIGYVKEMMEIDPTVFNRKARGTEFTISPYFLLVLGYGNYGICWEPYSKYNKATSKGRLAIPIFSKNPKEVIVIAFGDFRWSMAKELAGYHWMEEGLTGEYYQYHDSIKWKGDLKSKFVYDYFLWIVKESEGIQKLDREIRRIFWTKIPFPDKLKEELSKKGFYYQDLFKKDEVRKLSGL